MFKGKPSFRIPKHDKVIIKHHKDGLFRNGDDEGISKNSLYTCKNLFYNIKGGLVNRPTARSIGSGLPANSVHVSGVGYSGSLGDYLCEKDGIIYRKTSLTGSWSSVGTWSGPDDEDYTDILDFHTVSSTSSKTSTTTAINERYIDSTAVLVENAYVGYYLFINTQLRLITANTTTRIYIDGKFDITPAIGNTYNIYAKIPGMFCATNGPAVKVWDGTSLRTFGPSSGCSALSAKRITVENNRMFMVDGSNHSRVRFSILGVGDDFPKDNYIDVDFEITSLKNIKGRVVIYGKYDRNEILGDNPDNFSLLKNVTHKGALGGGTVANGTNVQMFLSNEGVEKLNAVDNATVDDGISLSDNIKDLLFIDNDFEAYKLRAHGTVSGGKYFLNIGGNIVVYDIEKSLLFGPSIFSTAEYSESLQTTDTGYDQVGEWTCSRDIDGKLFFGQGGGLYYVNHSDNNNLSNYTAIIESDKINLSDNGSKKKIRRIKQFFKSCERATEFKTYISVDGGSYELVSTKTYSFNSSEYQAGENFEYEIFMSKLGENIRYKTEIVQTGAGNADFNYVYEHLRTEIYIEKQYTY